MESNISFIEGRVGIPHNGFLSCDGTQIVLKRDNEVVFSTSFAETKAIEILNTAGAKNFAVITNENQRYTFTDIKNDAGNTVRWIAASLVVIVFAILAIMIRLQGFRSGSSFSQSPIFTVSLILLFGGLVISFTNFFWNKGLKKVDDPAGEATHRSLIHAWHEYFQKTFPDKVIMLKQPASPLQ
jgi:hypothetical protein